MCLKQERKESKKNKKTTTLLLEVMLIPLLQIKGKEVDTYFKE